LPRLQGRGSARKANQRTDGYNESKGKKINSSALEDRLTLRDRNGATTKKNTQPCRNKAKAQASSTEEWLVDMDIDPSVASVVNTRDIMWLVFGPYLLYI